jgi:hypothetical protein
VHRAHRVPKAKKASKVKKEIKGLWVKKGNRVHRDSLGNKA